MAQRHDVEHLLQASGSVYIGKSSKKHDKYKLPNGRIFTLSGTPKGSDFTVTLAALRRELRTDFAHLMDIGRKPSPKSVRGDRATLAEQLAVKGESLILDSVSTEDFSIEDDPLGNTTLGNTTPDEAPYKPNNRVVHDRAPRPSEVKVITPEQLIYANALLASEGQGAMNRYLDECRAGLVTATRQALDAVAHAFEGHKKMLQANAPSKSGRKSEDDMLTELVERTRAELEASRQRIEEARRVIEREESRIPKLESFLSTFDLLQTETADIVTILPPPPKPEPITLPEPVPVPVTPPPAPPPEPVAVPPSSRSRLSTQRVIDFLLPTFGCDDFDSIEFYARMRSTFPHDNLPQQQSIAPALAGLARQGYLERVARGRYKVIEQKSPTPTEHASEPELVEA